MKRSGNVWMLREYYTFADLMCHLDIRAENPPLQGPEAVGKNTCDQKKWKALSFNIQENSAKINQSFLIIILC